MTTIAFYKPDGVLSSFTGEPGQLTLSSFIKLPGVYSAGRLDKDSEGLLLLTDDGNLIHSLTDPQHLIPKTYFVQVEGEPTEKQLEQLRSGIWIKKRKTRKCKADKISAPNLPERLVPITPHGPTSWIQIILNEGMNRQIRHMTAAVGLPTLRLVRISIGSIELENLTLGRWRFLEIDELTKLSQFIHLTTQV